MVEVRTKFDENVMKEINKFQLKRVLWIYIFLSLIFVGCGTIFVVKNNEFSFLGVFFIVFGLLFAPLFILLIKVSQNKTVKSMSIMGNETLETYKFDEESVFIETKKGETFKGTTQADYSYFYMVKETDANWFLYINSAQMHVVPKDKIIEGSVEELNNIFARKLGTKFTPMKK